MQTESADGVAILSVLEAAHRLSAEKQRQLIEPLAHELETETARRVKLTILNPVGAACL
ncbi:hypothetical protein H8E77_22085 [bacterium]|nr:hypothetical protein [bacterium]